MQDKSSTERPQMGTPALRSCTRTMRRQQQQRNDNAALTQRHHSDNAVPPLRSHSGESALDCCARFKAPAHRALPTTALPPKCWTHGDQRCTAVQNGSCGGCRTLTRCGTRCKIPKTMATVTQQRRPVKLYHQAAVEKIINADDMHSDFQ